MSGITQRNVLRPDTPRRFDKCVSKMQNELHHSDKNQLKLQKKGRNADLRGGVPFVGVQNLRPGTWPTKAPHGPKRPTWCMCAAREVFCPQGPSHSSVV